MTTNSKKHDDLDLSTYLKHLEKMVADIDPWEYPEGKEKSTIARLHKVYYPANYQGNLQLRK